MLEDFQALPGLVALLLKYRAVLADRVPGGGRCVRQGRFLLMVNSHFPATLAVSAGRILVIR
jgi:hypothetical protein